MRELFAFFHFLLLDTVLLLMLFSKEYINKRYGNRESRYLKSEGEETEAHGG